MGLRLGLLSTANINRLILAAARASDDVDVVAVASRDAGRAAGYAREHGIERPHGSYEALLADPDVDAVYVSLPNALHVDWSVQALEAVYQSPGVLWVALVADGAIGELRALRASFSFPLADAGNVRLQPDLDGGSLMDVGCYCVSGLRLHAGEPERVTAQQVLAPSGVDIAFAATLRFRGDVIGTFPGSHERWLLEGTVRTFSLPPVTTSTCANIDGLSSSPGLASSMRTGTVRVSLVSVG